MRHSILLSVILLSIAVAGHTQQPAEKLDQWAIKNPIEKLYLHFDRENYLSGQTMWFRSYVYSEFNIGDKSTTLYVEFLDSSSTIISRKVFPLFNGFGKGQLEIPDSLRTGIYMVRAYSPTMLNHDNAFVYKRGFMISGSKQPVANPLIVPPDTRLEFFPEGGNFIVGYLNTVAFKATDANGFPITVSGIIKNNKGETITEFNSWHDGMGTAEIMAEANAGYYAVLSNDASGRKYALPESTNNGIGFHVQAAEEKLFFEIFQATKDPAFAPAYMVGQIQHRVIFKQPLEKMDGSITGAVSSANMLSGILQITVFNKDNMPLAERLCFINNGEYIQKASLVTDSISFSARGKNHYTLAFSDSIQGSFSVSVTDPAFDEGDFRKENIFSRLLLTADLPGYVHNPAWYFRTSSDSSTKAADLLMMTNGWRRFKWRSLLSQPLPSLRYKDPGYITVKGTVNIFGRQKTMNNKEYLLFITSGDSTRSMEMVTTNDLGEFKADSLVFYEKSIILFSEIPNKKNKIDVTLAPGDSIRRAYLLPLAKKRDVFPVPAAVPARDLLNEKLLAEYEAMMKAEGLTLSMITVTARKKTREQEVEERYASTLFASGAQKTYEFTSNNDLTAYRNVFDYLQARVPGLQVYRRGQDYVLYYRQRRTLMGGLIPMTLFLDEVRTDASLIAFIPGNQIAMVKVYDYFVGAEGGASGGALAVYTKKGDDLFNSPGAGSGQVPFVGYSIVKEFYTPDYSGVDKKNAAADHRMTLHWNPDMYVNGENEKVPVVFYNNDRARTFRVVIEGLTTDGKILMIEKLVTPKAF